MEIRKPKTISFKIDEKTEKRIYELIDNNLYIKNLSHFVEICIHEYLNNK